MGDLKNLKNTKKEKKVKDKLSQSKEPNMIMTAGATFGIQLFNSLLKSRLQETIGAQQRHCEPERARERARETFVTFLLQLHKTFCRKH